MWGSGREAYKPGRRWQNDGFTCPMAQKNAGEGKVDGAGRQVADDMSVRGVRGTVGFAVVVQRYTEAEASTDRTADEGPSQVRGWGTAAGGSGEVGQRRIYRKRGVGVGGWEPRSGWRPNGQHAGASPAMASERFPARYSRKHIP